jgi:hypothetical protein
MVSMHKNIRHWNISPHDGHKGMAGIIYTLHTSHLIEDWIY